MRNEFRELMMKKATGKLPKDELFHRITEFLKGQTMCTLCTCRDDVPRATPLEYYLNGTTLYIIGHRGVKLGNIRANPRVSVGVYNDVHPTWGNAGNWLGVKGVQIMGRANLITDDNPEYAEARRHFTSPTLSPARGDEKPRGRIMITVTMERVEYIDIALKLQGYASKQVWKASNS